jgi:Protein of unknown function (DUF2723)
MTGTEKWARPMALIDRWEGHVPWILAVVSGLLYFLTLAPTVGHTDAGELSAVAYTFGVAHPTGYPLFTLLGWIFTRIPMGSVAWRLNFMCMLFVTGGVYVWARFLREFYIQLRTSVKKGDSSYALRIKVANLLGTIVGTLMLCLGRTWWTQATGTEVYSLQCMLFGLMLWALLRAWYAKEDVFLRWGIFAVALAMCFTNHLTAIVVMPGVLYLYFVRFRLKLSSIKQGLGLAGIGILVLVVFYGMLVLVAQSHPAYNWGNASDRIRLWHHISGRQFSTFMFLGAKAFGKNLLAYFNRLPNELGWDLIWPKIPIWIMLGGIVFQGMSYTFERRREWAIFLGLGFFSNIFWAANYSIKDPEPYFLFSFMVVAFLGAMFLRWSWIGYKKFAPYFSGAFAIVLAFQLFWNFGAVNQREVRQYADYAQAALESLPPNAIVISRYWDGFVGPAYYLQACEGLRKDVTIVDYSLLHDRHWYVTQLRAQDPALTNALAGSLGEWEKAVSDFDLKGKVNPVILQPRFEAVYYGILDQLKTRPVFIGTEIFEGIASREIPQPKGMLPVPDAYFVKLRYPDSTNTYLPCPLPQAAKIRFGGDTEERERNDLLKMIGQAWAMRANYETQAGHTMEAQAWNSLIGSLPKRFVEAASK